VRRVKKLEILTEAEVVEAVRQFVIRIKKNK